MSETERYSDARRGGIPLLLLNAFALVLLLALWAYAAWFVPTVAGLGIAELDRAGVINEDALRKHYPDLAENTRHNLGRWTVAPGRRAALGAVGVGTGVAVGNIGIVVWLLLAKKRKPSGAAEQDAEQARPGQKRPGMSNPTVALVGLVLMLTALAMMVTCITVMYIGPFAVIALPALWTMALIIIGTVLGLASVRTRAGKAAAILGIVVLLLLAYVVFRWFAPSPPEIADPVRDISARCLSR